MSTLPKLSTDALRAVVAAMAERAGPQIAAATAAALAAGEIAPAVAARVTYCSRTAPGRISGGAM